MSDIQKISLTKDLEEKAKKLSLAGDEARIRILCLMFEYKKACVSDIASALDMSVAAVSHHLKLMREHGYFTTERIGTTVCYILVEDVFVKQLQTIICDC
ncbi:MAG: ArsR/SmtB family transcription factor [Patescibacteria group bacterium]